MPVPELSTGVSSKPPCAPIAPAATLVTPAATPVTLASTSAGSVTNREHPVADPGPLLKSSVSLLTNTPTTSTIAASASSLASQAVDLAGTQSPKAPTAPQLLTALSLFLLGFLFAAGLLHAALLSYLHDPLTLYADQRSEKLALLQASHGAFTSAAFGSSHVHNGFSPSAFDAAYGDTHSINLAVSGGSQSEQRALALHFLAQLTPPSTPAPCLVLLELNAGANFTSDHLVHPRAINIYDLPTTRLITHFITPTMPNTQRLGRQGFALSAAALHYANIGMLSDLLFTPPLDVATLTAETEHRGQRFELYTPANRGFIDQELAQATARPPRPEPDLLTPGHTELIDQLARASPTRHISFAYVNMPLITDPGLIPTLPDHLDTATQTVPIVDLARPDSYPQLYNIALWHDGAHLTGEGSALASTILARQLKLWYASHGGPAPCTP